MSWVAAATIGGSVLGAGASIYGANRNADALSDGGDEAARFQNRALDTQLALLRPQTEVGTGALGILAQLYGLPAPDGVDFDSLSGGGRNSGAQGVQNATQGLSPIPGASWRGRPVFTDGNGGVYAPRGRNATVSGGVDFLGQAGEGGAGLRFDGTRVRSASGRLSFRDGQFFDGQGNRANPIDVQAPTPIEQSGQSGTPSTGGLNLNDLVANNPLIQFNRQQGEQAIDRGAAARGLNQSGGTLQDLSRFNQDLAGAGVQQFVLNPLFQLAGFGNQGAGTSVNAVGANANNLSNLAANTASARGSAFQNAGNVVGNTLSDIGGALSVNRSTAQPAGFFGSSNPNQRIPGVDVPTLNMPGSAFYVPPPDPTRV